jgi:hypothetical protein
MAIFFYMFATLIVLSGIMVIMSRNPVHAVLWLIFAFCNGAGLMVLMGAEGKLTRFADVRRIYQWLKKNNTVAALNGIKQPNQSRNSDAPLKDASL